MHLRFTIRTRAARLVLAVCLASTLWAQPSPLARSVEAVSVTVSDMDRALDFYTRILPFEKISETEVAGEPFERLAGVFGLRAHTVRLRLGDEYLELAEYLAPQGRPIPPDARSNDRSFQHVAIIVSDMDKAYRWLRQNKVRHASSGPQRLPDWNPNAGGISAFYFLDPDGHPLEILEFPIGKGAAKWHQPTDKLFLGIDHTAIVIADTDASLAFYRDLLGMKVVGESENYGTEQEHLNNVFGARLRITALRAESGPGIELLEYLAPRDGRPFPSDEHPNDLIHRHTTLFVDQAGAVEKALRQHRTIEISFGVVEVPANTPNYHKGLLARDPDGHALLFAER